MLFVYFHSALATCQYSATTWVSHTRSHTTTDLLQQEITVEVETTKRANHLHLAPCQITITGI